MGGGQLSWFFVLLDNYGIILAHNVRNNPTRKCVPLALLSDSISVRRHLLAGFIDGDGSVTSPISFNIAIERTVQRTLGRDLVHLARGLGYAVGGFSEVVLAATDEKPQYEAFQFQVAGVQEYRVQALLPSQLPRYPTLQGTAGPVGTVHPETLPMRLAYKRVAAFVPYDGVDNRQLDTCYGNNYSWGFSLQRAPAVRGQSTTNIGCPLAWVPPAPAPAPGVPWVMGPPAPPALAGPTTDYVAITVQPRPARPLLPLEQPVEQTVLSSDFIVLHNSPSSFIFGTATNAYTARIYSPVHMGPSTDQIEATTFSFKETSVPSPPHTVSHQSIPVSVEEVYLALSKKVKCEYFNRELQLIHQLILVSSHLVRFPAAARKGKLRRMLQTLPSEHTDSLYFPSNIPNVEHYRILRLLPNECISLNSRDKAPYLLYALHHAHSRLITPPPSR